MKVVAAVLSALALAAPSLASGAEPARANQTLKPVPSLTPAATQRLWKQLVQKRRSAAPFSATEACKPLRSVFYAATDWLRLTTKLAAAPSPCADYYVSVPPLVADKTQLRGDQAWRIRALGPRFHALAEINFTAWSGWVTNNGSTWHAAGVEARRRMASAGYDVAAGDSWVVNEFSSAVRQGAGNARANVREFVRGLYEGDGTPERGAVFITGMGQGTTELSVYQARLQDWYEDAPFWRDMSAYVADWSQELYGDYRNWAAPGTTLDARRVALDDYLQHEVALARAAPGSASDARTFLETAYNPLANGAWAYSSAFGWTAVSADEMKSYVSAQVDAARAARPGAAEDRFGFAWSPKNLTAMPAADFTAQGDALLDRLAAAIRDSGETPAAACPIPWCTGDMDGAWLNSGWKTFATWKPSLLAYTTPAQALEAGAASGPITVQTQTWSGVALSATQPLSVSLSTTSPGGGFSTAPTGPWAASLTLVVPAGADSATVYYRDVRAGTATLTATAQSRQAAVQQVSVAPAAVSLVALTPASATVAPGASQTFVATATDAYGNAVPAGDPVWTLAPGTPGSLVPAGSTATFTAGGAGGTGAVTASVGGVSGSASVTVVGARVLSIAYSAVDRQLRVTASLVDGAGNPLAGASVGLRIARNGATYANRAVTTGADGTGSTTLYQIPGGCYATTVTSVSAPAWDGATPSNRYCR